MASSSEVLREYLVALGWQIDKEGAKKFDKVIQGTEKAANALTKQLFAVGAATTAMVASFAYNMEKLYYASKRTKSSVGNIQALEFGAEQIGISGETMRASLEGMAKSIRNNPGILALIKSFGIQVEGRDLSDVMRDTVKVLASMPHFVGAQFAGMFGMDEQTFLQMKENMAELDAAMLKRKQMAADMGVDADAAALASKEFNNAWREVVAQASLFKDVLAIAILPLTKEMAGVTKAVLSDWAKIIQDSGKGGESNSFFNRLRDGVRAMQGLGPWLGGGVTLTKEAERRSRLESSGVVTDASPVTPQASPVTPQDERAARLAKLAELEKKYGLPSGILARVWKTESDEGRAMLSPAGAKGDFGFMDSAAKDYGVDVTSFNSSAEGAARYFHNMLTKYGGDARMAAAAYNWGPGNVDRYGLGKAPAETQNYMDKVAGPAVNQKTDIHVHGADSPAETARIVLQGQQRVNADLVRNLGGASQ
mgnify:CR=1 FL=1